MSDSLRFTLFANLAATTKLERQVTVPELAELIERTRARSKEGLPLLKLAIFGDSPQIASGCLRHDANVRYVTGAEGDYDGEAMPFCEAVAHVRAAGVQAILYTSASHTSEKPRWRVLAPFYGQMWPGGRANMVGRLNAVLGGVLADESWRLSQAFYFGRAGNAPFQIAVVDGRHIDTLQGLAEQPRAERDYSFVGTAAECTEPTTDGIEALRYALKRILTAPCGEQEKTLNGMSYLIGRRIGAGQLPPEFALRILLREAARMVNYNPARPWRPEEVKRKVWRAIARGRQRPWASLAEIMRELDAAEWEALRHG
ncbi:MAG TPA: hypothetical protein VEK82_08350 [Stellaceae bacterium]|nr:hypothetical protein [Stellaceae bacterium]